MAKHSMLQRWSDIDEDDQLSWNSGIDGPVIEAGAETFVPAVWDILGCSEDDARECWDEEDLEVAPVPSGQNGKACLTQCCTTYLGPEWYVRANPESILRAFLRENGGAAHTDKLQVLHDTKPWPKGAIGSRSRSRRIFCSAARRFF